MLYTCKNPVTQIVTVGRFGWQARALAVEPRPFCALALRIKGGGTLQCGDKKFILEPSDVLYMPQGLAYSHDYTDTDLILFHFVTLHNDPEPEIYRLHNPEPVLQQFQKARQVWEQKESGYVCRCMSILYRIFSLLAENEATVTLPPHFLQAMDIFHQDCFSGDLRISAVCEQACISQTVFRELFKKHYGQTPVEYLTQLRLEQARSLIAEGMPVEQAALASGFSDGKYFSRVVKRRLGCTPRQLKSYGALS